jgi:hypothetical protein
MHTIESIAAELTEDAVLHAALSRLGIPLTEWFDCQNHCPGIAAVIEDTLRVNIAETARCNGTNLCF